MTGGRPVPPTRAGRGARVAAQAKVNLLLRVIAREASGFHQLETLFLRLDLSDGITVRRTLGTRSLDVRGDVDLSHLGDQEHNLAWRAAEAYLQASGQGGGFSIEIEKHIPIGGGLGGGSADAGAVLRALDLLADEPLGLAPLLRIGAALGADVPFLTGESAYALAWGRGERMLALVPPPQATVLVVVPPFAVNTAAAYGWLDEARGSRGDTTEPSVLDSTRLSDWSYLQSVAVNDFEPVVSARYKDINRAVATLRNDLGLALVMLSGSGSAVFGIMPPTGAGSVGTQPPTLRTATATRVEPVVLID